jgi:cobalamin biosynthesis protein CobD/CbiB
MNFFRSLMSSFTVAAFAAALLIALGTDVPLAGEHHAAGIINAIPSEDMRHAFRYVFGAATAMMACAALCLILMEERPLAGPGTAQPVEMAE